LIPPPQRAIRTPLSCCVAFVDVRTPGEHAGDGHLQGDHNIPVQELDRRLAELDKDGSGQIDMAEYIIWSLKDALARSSQRVVDLFRAWDEDRSGTIDKKEFFKAVRALGFDVEEKDANLVFDALDADKSGELDTLTGSA
jgi:Ca2+-binding EF-hand superfamily protein